MIPSEIDIREYARYAANVREIVRKELVDRTGKSVSPTVLRELVRSATMPIGIWMTNRSIASESEHTYRVTLEDSDRKDRLDYLRSTYNLVEANGYLKPTKILSRDIFQSLRNEMWRLGYIYEIGAGFVEEIQH